MYKKFKKLFFLVNEECFIFTESNIKLIDSNLSYNDKIFILIINLFRI